MPGIFFKFNARYSHFMDLLLGVGLLALDDQHALPRLDDTVSESRSDEDTIALTPAGASVVNPEASAGSPVASSSLKVSMRLPFLSVGGRRRRGYRRFENYRPGGRPDAMSFIRQVVALGGEPEPSA